MDAQAQADIQNVLSRLYAALDARAYDEVAGCFHPQGEWHRQGKLLYGHGEIVQALQQRSPTLVVHHLYGNCLFMPGTAGSVAVQYLLTVFQLESQDTAADRRIANPPQIGFCDAQLTRVGAGWRILSMKARTPTFTAVLTPPAAAART
ncbi:MAG: nuclear transport factor 2 family protein [Burkholderiaceae bacterium]